MSFASSTQLTFSPNHQPKTYQSPQPILSSIRTASTSLFTRPDDLLYRAQVGRADHSTPRQSARPCYCIFAAPPIIVARDGGHLDDMPKMRPFTVFKKRRGITSELTRACA